MPTRDRGKAGKPVRPIKTKRDYEGVKRLAGNLSVDTGLDSTAELRLKSLLEELDKFEDALDDDPDADLAEGSAYAGPRRRWSDDASGGEDS
jgi:hypothetical protein